jgi:hypothetical protein
MQQQQKRIEQQPVHQWVRVIVLRTAKPDLFPDERSDVLAVSSGRACLDHAPSLDYAPLQHARAR